MLKAERIAELLEKGRDPKTRDPLVITPTSAHADLEKSGAASIDLRLGAWFVSLKQTKMSHLDIRENSETKLTRRHYVPFGTDYYLHPRSFVLGVTLEWIRLPAYLGAYVIGKSSWGRRGLIIATAAGVHPGFKGCLTLELTNLGEIPIALKPGINICQLFIHEVTKSGGNGVEKSGFAGQRLPTLGRIEVDSFAQKLSDAFKCD